MDSITRIRVAYALRKQGIAVEAIAREVGRDRATVYRWLKGIKQRGIEGYIRHYRAAKKGRRRRKVHSYIVQRVLSIRRAYRDCCGQKIVYLLAQEGIKLSLSTVYRLLRQHRQLRKHTRTAKGQPARRGQAPREVVQMDTVELGGVFAFTAIDTYTREAFILMRPGLTSADGKAALEELARRFGPVQTLQTDGGSEFEGQFLEVVNQYARQHVIARPYRKNDQAFIECFNGTLRREEFGRTPFKRSDLALAQRRADDYPAYYHHQRPHLALGMRTPAQAFAESHLI